MLQIHKFYRKRKKNANFVNRSRKTTKFYPITKKSTWILLKNRKKNVNFAKRMLFSFLKKDQIQLKDHEKMLISIKDCKNHHRKRLHEARKFWQSIPNFVKKKRKTKYSQKFVQKMLISLKHKEFHQNVVKFVNLAKKNLKCANFIRLQEIHEIFSKNLNPPTKKKIKRSLKKILNLVKKNEWNYVKRLWKSVNLVKLLKTVKFIKRF